MKLDKCIDKILKNDEKGFSECDPDNLIINIRVEYLQRHQILISRLQDTILPEKPSHG